MSNEIRDTTEAIKGIVDAVPVYEDLLQPAVKELGKGLHTLSKTVHIALTPVSALIWGYDRIKAYVQTSLEHKLQNVPRENIIPPDPTVAGPALEAMRYAGHKIELREMFANLLATAMNSVTASNAHPSFVEVIRQITPDEAKIINYLGQHDYLPLVNIHQTLQNIEGEVTVYRNFSLIGEQAKCLNKDLVPSYLDNLRRLGIIEIPEGRHLTPINEKYKAIENHPFILSLLEKIKQKNGTPIIQQRYFYLTDFGKQFYKACI